MAFGDVEDINKLTAGESGLTANNVINKQSTEKKVQNEIAKKLGESFDNITMAVTAKSKTLNLMAQSISKKRSSNYKLTATIKKMTSQLEMALNKIKGGTAGEANIVNNILNTCQEKPPPWLYQST